MSGEGSSHGGARDNNEIKKMKKCLRGILELITKRKCKTLLTKVDLMESFHIWESNLEGIEVLLSWKTKRPSLMCEVSNQERDDCWAIALSRAISVLMKMKKINKNFHPTPEVLINGVGLQNLSPSLGLSDMTIAIPFVTSYVDQMIIRHRPELDDEEGNEEFERCIIRILANAPLGISFDSLPSYSDYHGEGTYVPTDLDFHLRLLERIPRHCVLLTGVGVKMRDGEAIEFWEVHESVGVNFGYMGFGRLARHKCLIREVFELGELIDHLN
ncbi:hypothetical protein AALP_AA6G312400 [Arabis alpina]|uniref:Peptidase C1A papain C-terminal domain-containing protein n=1 Tax=Arabis alpina TaxID=50452 RepID=A0A087GSW3_ARAAL|nr:hypothetical protein AALP_AA6G312400 [Arabis alpina]